MIVEESVELPVQADSSYEPSDAARGGSTAALSAHEDHAASPDAERGSALQKIAQLDIKGRIQLALKGTREERSILIRDGTKLIALAVLESPKLTDAEAEQFAAQRNVLEAVLRGLAMKRKYLKSYPVVRNLVFNPRTPIDVSLTLIKSLLAPDLRGLAGNREVSDTLRKLAARMCRQRSEAGRKKQ
ncbi:MAG: hypothetical protein H0X25_07790 [Acidobacteriales bacterium]|nr:hypothetical protein [Terriglobales bacterium]